jgi:hypothetical protein
MIGPGVHALTLGYASYPGYYEWQWNTDTAGSSDGKTLRARLQANPTRSNGRFQGSSDAALAQQINYATGWTMQARMKILGGGGGAVSTFGYRNAGDGCVTISVNGAGVVGVGDYGGSPDYRREATAQDGHGGVLNYVGSYHLFTVGAIKQADGNFVADVWIDGTQQYADMLGQDGLYHFYVGAFSGNVGNVVRIGEQFLIGDPDLDWVYDWVAIRNDGVHGDWAAVPEPSSLLALAGGLVGLAGVAIRRKR